MQQARDYAEILGPKFAYRVHRLLTDYDAAGMVRRSRRVRAAKRPGAARTPFRRFWQYLAIGCDICHMIVQRSMADTPPQPPAA